MNIFLLSLALVLSAVAGYLLGSVNFAIIVTKAFARRDIREFGSKNAGFTNVLRTLGKGPAALTLLGDFLKGTAAVLVGYGLVLLLTGDGTLLRFGGYFAAVGAILGHMFPLYYRFKGGKGILVTAGALLLLNPPVLLILLAVFLVAVLLSKIVSVASLSAAVAFPIATVVVGLCRQQRFLLWEAILSACIAGLVIFMHRENIRRLISGTENSFSSRSGKRGE